MDPEKPQDSEPKPRRRRKRMPWLDSVEEEEVEDDGVQKTMLIAGSAIVALVLFSTLIWYVYGRVEETDGLNEPLLVKAPEGPVKVEPKDRGGLEVPHQKRLVYERVTGEKEPLEEEVKKGPEEPLERPSEPKEAKLPATGPVTVEKPAEPDPAPKDPEPEPDPVARDPEPGPAKEPDPAAGSPLAMAGSYRVQLGAYSLRENAGQSWRVMQNRYLTILGSLDFEIAPVTLGRRQLYRLRAGPLASRAEADRTCRQLKAVGQDCMVVAP
ncbi:MAG: SPOR domain-containing protein [Sphingomonadales bacterium]